MPLTPKAMPDLIVTLPAYDILLQSTSLLTSSIESAASCKKNHLLGLVSFLDHFPSPHGVLCHVLLAMNSVFFASQRFVHASFIFETMKVSVGWHKWIDQGGKYLKIECLACKIACNLRVRLWPVQLSTQINLVHP